MITHLEFDKSQKRRRRFRRRTYTICPLLGAKRPTETCRRAKLALADQPLPMSRNLFLTRSYDVCIFQTRLLVRTQSAFRRRVWARLIASVVEAAAVAGELAAVLQ